MYALAIKNLPEGKDWLYEVKFDGYRCLAGKLNDGVTLWSRRGNLFTAQFPVLPSPAIVKAALRSSKRPRLQSCKSCPYFTGQPFEI